MHLCSIGLSMMKVCACILVEYSELVIVLIGTILPSILCPVIMILGYLKTQQSQLMYDRKFKSVDILNPIIRNYKKAPMSLN